MQAPRSPRAGPDLWAVPQAARRAGGQAAGPQAEGALPQLLTRQGPQGPRTIAGAGSASQLPHSAAPCPDPTDASDGATVAWSLRDSYACRKALLADRAPWAAAPGAHNGT